MTKEQKEVQQAFLDSEKETLNKLKVTYQNSLNDINSKIQILMARQDVDMQHVIYQLEYQEQLKTQISAILDTLQSNSFDTVSEYLTESYENGFIGTLYDLQGQGVPLIFPIEQGQVVKAIQNETKLSKNLYNSLGKDVKNLNKQIQSEISRGVSTNQSYSEIARNISGYADISRNNAMRIARTEAHRIQCTATSDVQYKAKEKGADVVKQWSSALDGATRDSHRQLDGQIREIDEPFEVNGMSVMKPGGFGDPAEDCNCRCALHQRARWALGEEELKTLKGRAEYFELDKSKDFDDYRIKYLNATTIQQMDPIVKEPLRVFTDEELMKIGSETNDIANRHIATESKWSGNIIVDESGVEYGKLWNCDIKTMAETSPHIILHEQIHAHSISHYNPQTYVQYMSIEEASVQLMTQEISKVEGIEIIESQYDTMTDALREINKTLNLYESDYDFAQRLIELPVTDRIDWIESKISELMMKGGTIQEYQRMSDLLDLVS